MFNEIQYPCMTSICLSQLDYSKGRWKRSWDLEKLLYLIGYNLMCTIVAVEVKTFFFLFFLFFVKIVNSLLFFVFYIMYIFSLYQILFLCKTDIYNLICLMKYNIRVCLAFFCLSVGL